MQRFRKSLSRELGVIKSSSDMNVQIVVRTGGTPK